MATINKTEAQFSDLDALFAAGLDDIADLPSFEVPPKGAYVCSVTTEIKEINKKPAIEAKFVVVETVELDDKDATPAAVGTEFSIAFILGSSFAEGKLKEFLAPFAAHFGTTGPGAVGQLVRDEIKDVTVALTLKHRMGGEDKDKVYADVRNIMVA